MIIFQTERLVVRQYQFPGDEENFFLLNGDEEVMRYIRPVKSREECKQFLLEQIDGYQKNPLMGRWAVEEKESGNFAGSFAFIPVEGKQDLQLGYALLKENWGKGYATELMRQGISYVFEKTSLEKIYGITESGNTASQKVLLKTGFTLQDTYLEKGKEICLFVLRK